MEIMSYDFSLNRKKMALVFTASIAAMILIFMTGWMAGVMISIPNGPRSTIGPAPGQERAAGVTPAGTPAPEQKQTPATPKTSVNQALRKPKTVISSLAQKKVPTAKAITTLVRMPIAKKPEVQKQQPIVETAPEKAATAPPEKMAFSVQTGVFIEEKNAEDMVKALNEKGYDPYIFETMSSKNEPLYLVRIGDYPDLDDASRALSEFRNKEGMQAIITAIDSSSAVSPMALLRGTPLKKEEPTGASDETKPAEAQGESKPNEVPGETKPAPRPLTQEMVFTVQVESCILEKNAITTANDLKKKGYEVFILKKQGLRGKTWYAVQIGSYKDRAEASQAASAFREKEKIVGVVMPIAPYLLKERKDASSLEKLEDAQSGGVAEKTQTGAAPKDAQSEVKAK
jgi:cell division septation protein DedD